MKTRLLIYLFLLIIGFNPIFAGTLTTGSILRSLDLLQQLDEDVTAKVKIIQKDRDQGTKTMESIYFAKDLNDLFLIVMTAPESEKGNGYLKSNNNLWMYRRNTRSFQHIGRDESIAGSDTDAGDFENAKYEEQYEAVTGPTGYDKIERETLSNIPTYKIEIKAKVPDVDYPKKIIWVRQDNYLPLKEESYSLSNTLMSTHYFLKYTKVNKKYIGIKHLIVDEFEKGNKTLWEISDISFEPIQTTVFTKGYLENLSK